MQDAIACAALWEEARTGDWTLCRASVGACHGRTAPGVLGVLDVEQLDTVLFYIHASQPPTVRAQGWAQGR